MEDSKQQLLDSNKKENDVKKEEKERRLMRITFLNLKGFNDKFSNCLIIFMIFLFCKFKNYKILNFENKKIIKNIII